MRNNQKCNYYTYKKQMKTVLLKNSVNYKNRIKIMIKFVLTLHSKVFNTIKIATF